MDFRFLLFDIVTRAALWVVFLRIVTLAVSRMRAGGRAYARVLWWAVCGLVLSESHLAVYNSVPIGSGSFWRLSVPLWALGSVWVAYGVWRVVPLMQRSRTSRSP
jgi:hypothetical protein